MSFYEFIETTQAILVSFILTDGWGDNALAENVNGSYKNELINNHRWKDVLEVEIATFEWVAWWNTTRLHQALDYRTPVEVENDYWRIASTSEKIKSGQMPRKQTRDTSGAKACYRLVGQRSDRFGFENICDDLSSIFAAGEPVGFLPVKR